MSSSASQQYVDQAREEKEKRRDAFLDDAKFAKLVETFSGHAILIGGVVIEVKSPSSYHAEFLVSALRAASGPREAGPQRAGQ